MLRRETKGFEFSSFQMSCSPVLSDVVDLSRDAVSCFGFPLSLFTTFGERVLTESLETSPALPTSHVV